MPFKNCLFCYKNVEKEEKEEETKKKLKIVLRSVKRRKVSNDYFKNVG